MVVYLYLKKTVNNIAITTFSVTHFPCTHMHYYTHNMREVISVFFAQCLSNSMLV